MGVVWRVLASIIALASLIVTVPASLWLTLMALMLFLPANERLYPPDWIDLLGWPPMLAVVAATGWVIYRLWRPHLVDQQ